ncbi:MAG: oligosaccharide flippase family protein [Bacteroidota bacterium]
MTFLVFSASKLPLIKNLFANISLIVLLNMLVKPVWVLVEMEIQDQIGHGDWGLYSALFSLAFLLVALADIGINSFTAKTLASDPTRLKAYFPNLFSVKILAQFLYPVLMFGIGYLLGYRGEALYWLVLLSLTQAGLQFLQFFRSSFQAGQRFLLDGLFSIAERVILLVFVAYLFFTTLSVERFLYVHLMTISLVVVSAYVIFSSLYGWLRPRIDQKLLKRLVKESFPFLMMTILYSIHDKVDQVMLERMAGDEENGYYVAGYRWLDAFNMYLWTILPIFFARFAFFLYQPKEQERLLHFGQIIAALPMLFVAGFVWFYGEYLLFPFDQSSPEELATILTCLKTIFLAAGLNGIFAIYSTYLTSTGHVRPVNYIVSGSILLNVILNIFLIPRYGAVACAWSTVISYTAMDLAYLLYIHFKAPVSVAFLNLLGLAVAGLGMFLTFWGLYALATPWYVTSGLAGISLLAISRLWGLISWEKIRSFKL